ncbi:hypothetical protein PRIPAC_94401, partial [Pristionchus pacificus]
SVSGHRSVLHRWTPHQCSITIMRLPLLALICIAYVHTQTPVIGGSCSLGTSDVQIGGKSTQFFLKCENTSDSPSGEGVWVVKSRAASPPAPEPVQHTRPKVMHKQPNTCEQDINAREGESCAVSETCLQTHQDAPSSYLQCEQTKMMWHRRDCHDNTIFNFEQQSCIVPKRVHSLSRCPQCYDQNGCTGCPYGYNYNSVNTNQQRPFSFSAYNTDRQVVSSNGLVCTYSSCSNSNPCSVGSCNNGYCCSSNSIPSFSSGCNGIGCGAAPAIVQIPSVSSSFCPGGGYSVGSCNYGSCSNGYQCYQGSCCPSYQPATAIAFTCPGGGSPVGSCVNGGCASGYNCNSNYCCAAQNPFVCIDGTQAVGACVNGACGTGYNCNNGLCCASSSATPRCLDGSPAVGACIPSCTGDMCGGVTVTYSCGSGYTCTTGNICCQTSACPLGGTPIGPPVNGLCPGGYTLQGNQCCSTTGTCPAGSTLVGPAVNNACPVGTLVGSVCCQTAVTCAATISNGPCNADNTCPTAGYSCDTTNNFCCPVVDYTNPANIIGPAIGGLCPIGYVMVMIPGGAAEGECVSLQSVPGVCAEAVQQGPCPNGVGCTGAFTCFLLAEVCCPTTMRMHRMPAGLPFSKPVSHLMPPRSPLIGGCPDGTGAASACINGLCGAGLSCVNDLCCAISEPSSVPRSACPDGQPAVSGCFADGQCGGGMVCVSGANLCCPPSSIPHTPSPLANMMRSRPIGGRCDTHAQCVGYGEGLSQCEYGVCRCTPIAYTQGIACVRRKKL